MLPGTEVTSKCHATGIHNECSTGADGDAPAPERTTRKPFSTGIGVTDGILVVVTDAQRGILRGVELLDTGLDFTANLSLRHSTAHYTDGYYYTASVTMGGPSRGVDETVATDVNPVNGSSVVTTHRVYEVCSQADLLPG